MFISRTNKAMRICWLDTQGGANENEKSYEFTHYSGPTYIYYHKIK